MNDQPKLKSITVYYLPELKLEPEKYETTGKAGYAIHKEKNEIGIIGYRLFCGSRTVLIPKENIHKIETEL
jgi:hypothetical protein